MSDRHHLTSALTAIALVSALLTGCTDSNTQTTTAPEHAESVDSASAVVSRPEEDRGFETPETAFAALKTAEKGKDYPALLDVFTSDSQKMVAARMIFGLGITAAFASMSDESKQDEVKTIFARHGLSDEKKMQTPPPGITKDSTRTERSIAMGNMIPNPVAFAVEAYQWIDQQPGSDSGGFPDGEPVDIVVDGSTAQGSLKTRRGRAAIAFKRTNTGWLIDLTAGEMSPPDGKTVSGSGRMDGFMRLNPEPNDVPVAGDISPAEINTSWKTEIDVKEQPAIDVLKKLAAQWSLKIFDQSKLTESLKQKVSVTLKDVSPLQIIEEVSSQVNVHPRYRAGAVAFNEGPRTLPVAFAGPFLIEVTKTEEYVPNAFAAIHFQCFAAGLSGAAIAEIAKRRISNSEEPDHLNFLTGILKGGNGADIQPQFQPGFEIKASQTTVLFTANFEVSNLLQAVEAISAFDGEITWSWPAEVGTARIEDFDTQASATVGDAVVELSRSDPNSSIGVNLKNVSPDDVSVKAFDADGKEIERARIWSYTINGKPATSLSASGKPKTFEFEIIVKRHRSSFPFHFPVIPLAHHQDMPATLEPPTFEGDVPVAVEYVRIDENNNSKTAIFHWTNHSNKDIHGLSADIDYVDADGKTLETKDKKIAVGRVMLGYQESKETIFLGDFPPDGTVSANVRLKKVDFSDTTSWSAADE